MTVRVALSAFIQETEDVSGDEMGRALNRGYAERSAEVFKLMLAPAQSPSQPLVEVQEPEQLARRFHETYERLAPSFGYETRPDTRASR